jgi:hypothetical protein
VSLLLLTYLFLDIANPMMPAAVQFVDGAIQVVQADRARPDADLPIPAFPARGRMIVTPDRSLTPMRRLRRVSPVRRRVPCRPRFPVSRAATTSGIDDH